MGRNNISSKSTPEVPQVNSENGNKSNRYVVIRAGHRVSAEEYDNLDDPIAQNELEFWKRVEKNHSWGAPVEIVTYDNKLHRVW